MDNLIVLNIEQLQRLSSDRPSLDAADECEVQCKIFVSDTAETPISATGSTNAVHESFAWKLLDR